MGGDLANESLFPSLRPAGKAAAAAPVASNNCWAAIMVRMCIWVVAVLLLYERLNHICVSMRGLMVYVYTCA